MCDENGRRIFTSGDYSDGKASLTAETLPLPGGILVSYVPNLTDAVLTNEQALRVADYGPTKVGPVLNVEQMGKDVGLLGRTMIVDRIPAGIVVFGSNPGSGS
jgi:hypothetical protein